MNIDEIVAAYGAAWNETDQARRAALLEQSWADGGVYNDPTATVDGRAALVDHIGGFHAAMPGHTIDLVSAVDSYNDVFRFAWVMRKGEDVAVEGIDFGELAADGRIQRIVGFFGPFPPLD
ncbi:MAG TPA: nuclear transport factor 2 family protein [Acidimicrobiales bacterium]|nr:nuclear transport factor 2 family protein [Acidimicrobiales bacterium]